MNLNFYDKLGYSYTAKFAVKKLDTDGQFSVSLTEILDSNGDAIFSESTATNAQLASLFGTQTSTSTDYSLNSGYSYNNGTYTYNDGTTDYTLTADPDKEGYFTYTDGTGATISVTYADIYSGFSTDTLDRLNFTDSAGNAAAKASSTVAANGTITIADNTVSTTLYFNTDDGTFSGIGTAGIDNAILNLSSSGLFTNGNFEDIDIDFSTTQNTNNGGKSTIGIDAGDTDGTTGKGKKLGALIGLSVSTNGEIYGTYDNGNTELLCQIAVAQFANAAGLEKVGDNCYATTLNSGDFDGIGVDITADGSSMSSGELEMSNVDLSTEFTQMITTQRGFQANSRVITTSDTLLEELVNLKR